MRDLVSIFVDTDRGILPNEWDEDEWDDEDDDYDDPDNDYFRVRDLKREEEEAWGEA